MTQRILIALFIVSAFLASPLAAQAQMPGGVQVPQVPSTGSLPTGALSKDSLLQQAQGFAPALTPTKPGWPACPANRQTVDRILPIAESTTRQLPQTAAILT